ncbi:MAG: N-acetyltransferase [Pseudomonadota bacterium]
MNWHIRTERTEDVAAIHSLTQRAFEGLSYSDGTEPHIINKLRADGDLSLSLVAEDENIIGHIAFSPVTIDEKVGWTGLGPISVEPTCQGIGVGAALMHAGLAQMKAARALGCVLIGDPRYYSRFGFKADGAIQFGEVDAKFVQWLAFGTVSPQGAVAYSPAFG